MLDRKLVKSVATETLLMMGKSIPVAGKGIELWQAVSAQRERAGNAEQIAELEARLSRFERKQQALAAETMQQVLAELRSDASHQARHDALQDLHDMKQAGYLVGAFEGLIQRSPHYQSIQRTPQAYGKLLEPGETLAPYTIPIFVSFDGAPRILQVRLGMLENLLVPINNAQTLTAGSDVWGIQSQDTLQQDMLQAEISALIERAAAHRLRLSPPSSPSRPWLVRAEMRVQEWIERRAQGSATSGRQGSKPSKKVHFPQSPVLQQAFEDTRRRSRFVDPQGVIQAAAASRDPDALWLALVARYQLFEPGVETEVLELAEHYPTNLNILQMKASFHPGLAQDCAEVAMRTDADAVQAWICSALANFQDKNFEKVEESLNKAQHYEEGSDRTLRVWLMIDTDQTDAAVRESKLLLESTARPSRSLYLLHYAALQASGESIDTLLAFAKRWASEFPRDGEARYIMSQLLLAEDRLEDAMLMAEEATSRQPWRAEHWDLLLDLHWAQESSLKDVEEALQRARSAGISDERLSHHRAEVCLSRLDHSGAAEFARVALGIDPQNQRALEVLVVSMMAAGQVEQALAPALTALDADSESLPIRTLTGLCSGEVLEFLAPGHQDSSDLSPRCSPGLRYVFSAPWPHSWWDIDLPAPLVSAHAWVAPKAPYRRTQFNGEASILKDLSSGSGDFGEVWKWVERVKVSELKELLTLHFTFQHDDVLRARAMDVLSSVQFEDGVQPKDLERLRLLGKIIQTVTIDLNPEYRDVAMTPDQARRISPRIERVLYELEGRHEEDCYWLPVGLEKVLDWPDLQDFQHIDHDVFEVLQDIQRFIEASNIDSALKFIRKLTQQDEQFLSKIWRRSAQSVGLHNPVVSQTATLVSSIIRLCNRPAHRISLEKEAALAKLKLNGVGHKALAKHLLVADWMCRLLHKRAVGLL